MATPAQAPSTGTIYGLHDPNGQLGKKRGPYLTRNFKDGVVGALQAVTG